MNRAATIPAALAAVVLACFAGRAQADDWPQWRGPNRDGVSKETGWQSRWPEGGPKILWRARVGRGYSSFAVVAGRAFTMGNAGDEDTVFCLDADSGRVLWTHTYRCSGGDHPGPRMTPTVDGDVLYTLSQEGRLFALDAATGDVRWAKHLPDDFGAKPAGWGFACSPLVLGEHLILDAGPALCLQKATGELVWKAGEDKAGYSSPVAFEMSGRTVLALFPEFGPVVREAAGGKELARLRWKTEWGVNAATPIVSGGRIFYSSGYGTGCTLLEPAAEGFSEIYKNRNMRNHANSCVLHEGHLYGFDGQVGGGGRLTCLEFATGERRWQQDGLGTGALMIADSKLIIQGERGDLAVAEASPEGYKELARAKILDGTCWTTPVLAGGRIFCRNHDGDVVCLDVRQK